MRGNNGAAARHTKTNACRKGENRMKSSMGMGQAVAVAAGMAAGAAVMYAATRDNRQIRKTVHRMARGAEKTLADLDRMVSHYTR